MLRELWRRKWRHTYDVTTATVENALGAGCTVAFTIGHYDWVVRGRAPSDSATYVVTEVYRWRVRKVGILDWRRGTITPIVPGLKPVRVQHMIHVGAKELLELAQFQLHGIGSVTDTEYQTAAHDAVSIMRTVGLLPADLTQVIEQLANLRESRVAEVDIRVLPDTPGADVNLLVDQLAMTLRHTRAG